MVKPIGGNDGIKGTPRNTERPGNSPKPVIIKKRSNTPTKIEGNEKAPISSTDSLRDKFKEIQAERNVAKGLAEAIKDIDAFPPAGIKEGGKARSVGNALGQPKSTINSPFQDQVRDAVDGPTPHALTHQGPRTVKIPA